MERVEQFAIYLENNDEIVFTTRLLAALYSDNIVLHAIPVTTYLRKFLHVHSCVETMSIRYRSC